MDFESARDFDHSFVACCIPFTTCWMPLHNALKFILVYPNKNQPCKKKTYFGEWIWNQFSGNPFFVFLRRNRNNKIKGWKLEHRVLCVYSICGKRSSTLNFIFWFNFDFQFQLQIRCIIVNVGKSFNGNASENFCAEWIKNLTRFFCFKSLVVAMHWQRHTNQRLNLMFKRHCSVGNVFEKFVAISKAFYSLEHTICIHSGSSWDRNGILWSRRMKTEKWMRRDKVDVSKRKKFTPLSWVAPCATHRQHPMFMQSLFRFEWRKASE